MAKISTYPIISIPTIDDLLIGTDVNDLNNTKNFTIGDIGTLIGQDYVPYVGATGNVNLGAFNITGSGFIVGGGTASQFLKADGTLDSTAYTPQTRTLTINGTTYNLSANRSWDLNTIDSLTTTGTSGAATYVGKVLNIPVYQAQGNYITQLSGEATGSGPGNATVTLDNTAVISKILTGLNVTGGTVVSTDTILQAFGKIQNQINGLAGGVEYQGVWNAATNTPTLQSSVGTQGHYYVVDVAGNTNLNGITDWQLGDWAIYNGSVWQKVDNTDAVVSVNGYVGAVVLTASDVGAVPTTRTLTINGVGYNLSADRVWTVGDVRTDGSYANPSWITSLGWSKITNTPTTLAGYGITDGALNTTTLTINGTTFDLTANRSWSVGTVTSVGTSGPLTGGTITGSGTIGITQSGASSDGYLSSTDWNTFNSKQGAISVNAPLTFVSGVIGITQSGASTDGYLSSTDWNTFNSKVSGSGTANTLPMWGSASSLINSPLSYAADTFNFQYNSATGGTVVFTNSNGAAYAYTIQMNNFGSPRSTIHSYTDGLIIQSIGGTQVSRMFANGNLILGTGTVDNGYKLEVTGDLYLSSIVNATVDTDRFIVSDGGLIKYRTGAQILSDIGAVSSVGLTMPAAFTVSNSPITSSGTIAVTAAGTAAQYIRGDGTLADFPGGGGGGGASVSYYLNGSVNQGTFGGNTYYEMSKTPIFGAGTDFNISVDGYVAQFITDVGDPDALLIPGGNWNFETYFSASSGGGTPTFYIELYKYDGTTFTLIASNSTNPELIAFGTTVSPYFSALAVPETVLLSTDRLAIRIYVSTSGRTITLHTENSNLCQVITTFTTGLTALNGLTKQVQYFQTGTSGTDFNISSSVATHTFNLPTASATNRGALSSSDWTTFNNKIGGTLATGQVAFGTAANTIGGDNGLFWDNTNKRLGVGVTTPLFNLDVQSSTNTIIRAFGTSIGRLSLQNSTKHYSISVQGSDLFFFDETASATRWRITSTGVFQSNGAQTIQTSTGALTLATAAGNGNIVLSPNGTGVVSTLNNVGIGTATPTFTSGSGLEIERSDANSTIRLQRIGTSPSSMELRSGANTGEISVTSNSPLLFFTNGTERWRISETGILQSNGAQTIQTNSGALTLQPSGGLSTGINLTNNVNIYSALNTGVIRNTITNGSIVISGGNGTGDGANLILGGSTGTNQVQVRIGTTNHSIFATTGNLLIGTTTDSGFRLDVNGTAMVQGNLNVSTGGITLTGAQTIQTSTGNLTLATAAGNGNILLIPNGTGNVGVGNNSPDVKLVVSDSANLLQMRIGSLTAGISPLIRIQGRNTANTTNRYADIKFDADLGIFTLMAPGTSAPSVNALNIFTGGNVGINTTTDAGFRLDVNGTTRLNGLQTFQGTTASDTAPLGSELTTTGTGTNWTGTDFATGYTHVVGSTASLTTSLAAVVGTYYQITYTVTGRTAGSFTINYGGTSTVGLTGTGNTGPVATTTATLEIVPTSTFDGTIILSVRTISNASATTSFTTSGGTIVNEIRANNTGNNTFVGLNTGRRNTTGLNNTFLGMNSGVNNTTASNNTFVGRGSGFSNSTGTSNSFFGTSAGLNNTTGNSNSFFGRESGLNNTTGISNSFFGVNAGASNTTGIQNTFLGVDTAANLSTGSNNLMAGVRAGRFIADGTTYVTIANNSVFLGFDTRANADNQTNQIVIGHTAIGLGSNTTVIGNSSTTFGRWFGSLLLGTSTNVASSIFTMSSTTQGFLPPRMTAAQRTAIASPAEGLIVFQTDSVIGLYIYANATWRSLTMV